MLRCCRPYMSGRRAGVRRAAARQVCNTTTDGKRAASMQSEGSSERAKGGVDAGCGRQLWLAPPRRDGLNERGTGGRAASRWGAVARRFAGGLRGGVGVRVGDGSGRGSTRPAGHGPRANSSGGGTGRRTHRLGHFHPGLRRLVPHLWGPHGRHRLLLGKQPLRAGAATSGPFHPGLRRS